MFELKWWKLSWLNIIRNTRRSLIAMLVIAMGSSAVLLAAGYVSATFDGLKESTIQGGVGHLQLALPKAFDDREADQQGISPQKLNKALTQLNAMPEVRLTTNRVLFEGLVSSGDITIAAIGRGVQIENEKQISVFNPIIEGRQLQADESDQYSAVLGVDLARDLKVSVGDSVTLLATTKYQGINAIDVTVMGLNQSGIPEMDKRSVMIPLTAAQVLKDSNDVNRIVIALHDTDTTDIVATKIQQELPFLEGRTWHQLFPFYGAVVTLYKGIFSIMGSIILFVVFLSISNTMVMTVMERVREGGTFRAYGFSRSRVVGLFSQEGFLLGLGGSVIGIAIATLIILLVNSVEILMPPPPGRSTAYRLILNWENTVVLGTLAVMTCCGCLAAWLPARKMSKISITKALNHY